MQPAPATKPDIRAIFFDVDGTLISYNTHIMPPSAVQALHALRAKGIKLFVATGRHKTEAAALDKYFDFDGYITLNGQICYSKTETFYKRSIPKEDVATVVAYLQKTGLPCHFVREEYIFTNLVNNKVRSMCRLVDVPVPRIEPVENALETDIYQMVAHMNAAEEGRLFSSTQGVEATRWHSDFFDIVPKGGSKKIGIEKLLAHYGLQKQHTMAFGDGANDIPMLQAVQYGIAMGNAAPQVKQEATHVAPNVDADGISRALQHFGLL